MLVNLSTHPVALTYSGLSEAMRDAMHRAVTHTGVPLFIAVPEGSSEVMLDVQLADLMGLTRKTGPERSPAAVALVDLALAGFVMLPATGPSLFLLAPSNCVFALPPFLMEVDAWVQKIAPRWLAKRSHLQLMLATACRQATEFELDGFVKLHSWLLEQGVDSKFSTAAPAYLLLRCIEFADANALGRDLRHGYLIWRASEADKTMNFKQFMSDPKNLAGMRVHGHERERIELKAHIERRHARENQRKAERRAERPDGPFVENLRRIASTDDVSSSDEYFAALTGGSSVKGFRPDDWLDNPINYPGRPSIDIAKLGANWFIAFRAFLAHRRKDYETDGQVRSALIVLADYVLLYLPWWMSRHPGTTLDFPSSPKKFLRFFYVDRTRFHTEQAQGLGALPRTLNEMLPLRRPTPGSRNVARLAMQQFFSFVQTYFEDDSRFVTKGMQNPFRTDFDNEVAGRASKTDKVPFAEDVFPFLIHYGQAVEAFGEFLQQEAYLRNRFRELPNGPRTGYDTAEWGYVPVFWYQRRRYQLDWVPNIFTISKRTLKSNADGLEGLYVQGRRINVGANRNVTLNFPHLTVARLLMAMAESGLRAQSLQWLDRRTFDKLAPRLASLASLHGDALNQNYHALYINTDKTHEEWKNLVSWRVRRSLLAEYYFQESVVDKFRSVEVPYEDRENSRFLPVNALFRSDRAAKPVSDSLYDYRWVEYLFGFQAFYNRKDGTDRSDSDDALILLRERDEWVEGGTISDVYRAIHTPHSCRATYATLKDGDLEVSEIAEQLGHSNTIVTNTYQVPQIKRLLAKLKAIDARTMEGEAYDPTGESSARLHPERKDSSVRLAFERNREQAIADFRFIPGVALWSLSELDGDASTLNLLRQSPSSIIRWHPTHACPVGNQCPKEVIANTGGMNRCGICPLAAKCIDHLPGIEAKQAELHERIRTAAARQQLLERKGCNQTDIDNLHREMSLDTKELLGWKLSAEILRSAQREFGEGDKTYHVDQPELVRKQLELVTRNRSESEFFLQRIADSNAYPSLESPEVRAKALRYTRLILAKQGRLDEAAFLDVPPHSELTVFASLMKPYVDANGLTLEQVASAVEELPRIVALPSASTTPLLAGA
jgi:hypothetical protein